MAKLEVVCQGKVDKKLCTDDVVMDAPMAEPVQHIGEGSQRIILEEGRPSRPSAKQYIRLKVKDQQGEWKVTFKRAAPLCELKNVYCSRQGLQASSVRFMVGNEQIAAGATAENMRLEDGDSIDVMMEPG